MKLYSGLLQFFYYISQDIFFFIKKQDQKCQTQNFMISILYKVWAYVSYSLTLLICYRRNISIYVWFTIILAFFDNCLKFWSSNTFSGHDRLEAQLWSLHCPKCLFPENWRSMTREFSTVSRLKLNSSLFCIWANHWQVFSSSFWGPITWWQKWQS